MPNSVRTFGILRRIEAADATDSSPAQARFRTAAVDIARSENLGRARFNFVIVPLDAPPSDALHAGGEAFRAPRLLPPSGELTALAFGVCTLGHGIERKVSALFAQRRISLALALDRLGNQMLMEASRYLQDRILAEVRRRGLDMAGELRAGDPGLALEAQPAVLRLAGAGQIGVSLTGTLALDPLKSVSIVFGVGRDLPLARWTRCDDCRSRAKCRHYSRQSVLAAQVGGGG